MPWRAYRHDGTRSSDYSRLAPGTVGSAGACDDDNAASVFFSLAFAVKQVLVAVAVALSCHASCFAAVPLPQECDLRRFPAHLSDAQSRVVWLTSFLATAEQKHSFAGATAQPFRQALDICKAKREAGSSDLQPPGSGEVISQMKCEALLICSRIEAIQME